MKTLALIITISLITAITSGNGHIRPGDPGSFSDVKVYLKKGIGRGTTTTYKVTADMHFNTASTFKVSRTLIGSYVSIYVDLVPGGTTKDVYDYVLMDYNQIAAKGTTYKLYMRSTNTSIVTEDGPYYSKGAEEE